MPEPLPTVTLNGAQRALESGDTLTHLVTEATGRNISDEPTDARGLAVALNSRVVPRRLWASTLLSAGDQVELVSAAQGG